VTCSSRTGTTTRWTRHGRRDRRVRGRVRSRRRTGRPGRPDLRAGRRSLRGQQPRAGPALRRRDPARSRASLPAVVGTAGATALTFGPDGDLFVTSIHTAQVLRYDGTTGAFEGVFASGGGLDAPGSLVFGPDRRPVRLQQRHRPGAALRTGRPARSSGSLPPRTFAVLQASSSGLAVTCTWPTGPRTRSCATTAPRRRVRRRVRERAAGWTPHPTWSSGTNRRRRRSPRCSRSAVAGLLAVAFRKRAAP